MIRVFADFNKFIVPNNQLVLGKISDYPQSYAKITEAILNNQDLEVVVQHPTIFQWVKNSLVRYPQGLFAIEIYDARSILIQRWNMDIPTSVSNEEITQTGLLTSELHPQPGFTFEDTLLANYYAPNLTAKTFPFTKLSSLLERVDPQQWKTNLEIPLLARTLRSRLEEWKSKARSSEQRQLVEMFEADPHVLKLQLMQFRVLHNYPSIGKAVLEEAFDIFQTLKLHLEDLKVEESEIPETILQVTYFLNNQPLKNLDDLVALLNQMSGLLTVEFNIIEKHLQDNPDWINPELMDQIEEKFDSHSHQISRKIATLRRMIQPAKPQTPDLNWDVETMLSWATESYLPFQAWCDRQEQFDPDLYSIGDRFSEWLMKNWEKIHANSNRMVFNILPNKAVVLKRDGVVNLVLVIDNLGWSFAEVLPGLFQERGFHLAGIEPYIAMLPSETEISKKCLLSGTVGYQEIDDTTYKGIIEKGWVPYFNDKAFHYFSDIGSLGSVEDIKASTYVVNYLAVDRALHQSASEIGMPHRDHIHHLLGHLIDNVVAFIEKHNLQQNIYIHVVSDHGSTRIPSQIKNDLDKTFYKTDGFNARSHRYVTVSEERFASLAENLKQDCFFLPANDFLNPENVLCARRGNRFLSTDETSYIHGGLLPEEVIIPYMFFEPIYTGTLDLTVILKKNEFRYRLETVELEIGNPNENEVEQVQISLLNGNVDSKPVRISSLASKTSTTVQFQARFKKTSILEEQNKLQIRIRFSHRGDEQVFNIYPKITMKSMVEQRGDSIFNDF